MPFLQYTRIEEATEAIVDNLKVVANSVVQAWSMSISSWLYR